MAILDIYRFQWRQTIAILIFSVLCSTSIQCGTPFIATESPHSPPPSLPSEPSEGDDGELEKESRSESEEIEQRDSASDQRSEVITSSRSQGAEQTESVGDRQDGYPTELGEGTSEGESKSNDTQKKRRRREVEFLTLQVNETYCTLLGRLYGGIPLIRTP